MNDSSRKRIAKEIESIENNFTNYEINILDINEAKTEINIEIITPNYNKLVFTLPNDYPFKPPKELKLNGQNYRFLLKNMPKRVEYLYYHPNIMYVDERCTFKHYKIPECICCSSLLCPDNWSPVMRLERILIEINQHNELKRNIMYKLRLKEIFDKSEMPLELFRSIIVFLI